jgi:3-oxoadipate enol-lactonase/4-carboxymuconolactone decarboxylase
MRRRDFLIGGSLAAAACVHAPEPPSSFSEVRWFTASDGVRIAWRDSGNAGAPAILFCNGGGQAMAIWNSIAGPLTETHRVILHDRRANGDSDPGAPESHSFETFRDDALGVLDLAGVSKATVCGLAFGSRVATRIALDAPARVGGLILFDATGGPAAPEPQRRAGAEEAERLRTAAGVATPARDPAWTATRNPDAASFNGRALRGQPEWIAGLSGIRCPTLVAVGEQDPNLEGGRRMASEIPGARFETMPMTGHGSNAQRPDLLLVLIKDFLKQNRL